MGYWSRGTLSRTCTQHCSPFKLKQVYVAGLVGILAFATSLIVPLRV